MSQTATSDDYAVKGIVFPTTIYEPTGRAVHECQQDVADAWANGKLPTHETGRSKKGRRSTDENQAAVLRTAPRRNGRVNFKGYQFPDGSGLLKHYSTIEAIRTIEGLIISNSECYARGRARCSVPNFKHGSLPLSKLNMKLGDDNTIYEIVAINELANEEDAEIVFESGDAMLGSEIHE
jgi:hypothetical protein